jgi:hypothetical protein
LFGFVAAFATCHGHRSLRRIRRPTARAADYTDLWWIPAESGWGVNVVHTDNFMFLTFFIYGQDHKPTWYSADLLLDASGAFTGGLYATTGTYYVQPWNTGDVGAAQQVGNASFRPSTTNTYEATLIYVVDGVGTVTKAVSRLPLTPPIIGGQYTGGISALQTSCNNSGSNGAYKLTYDLQVAQSNAGAATFTFKYANYSCSLLGKPRPAWPAVHDARRRIQMHEWFLGIGRSIGNSRDRPRRRREMDGQHGFGLPRKCTVLRGSTLTTPDAAGARTRTTRLRRPLPR